VKPRCAAAFLVSWSVAASARADLADDVDKLAVAWRPAARVVVLPPRFPVAGETTAIVLPPWAASRAGNGCTTVAVVGAVSTTFALRLSSSDATSLIADSFLPSVAGTAQIVRCGPEREALAVIGLQMRSPHGVLETIVATSESPLIELRAVLPHRDPGTITAAPAAGPPPPPAALALRVAAVERFFAREDISGLRRRLAPTDANGTGQILLDLSPGCHHLFVLAAPSKNADTVQDVDAELVWANGSVGSSDRTDSPDAALLACTGERRLGVLSYGGAAVEAPVFVLHGKKELPQGLPPGIGPDARGRMAKALVERHLVLPSRQPVYASLGVAGITELPIEVEPGRCYVAMATPIQGETKLLALNAEAGTRRTRAHTDEADAALVSTFCVGAVDRGKLEVEAHGIDLVWLSALWPTARLGLGSETP
jgi:hypothetical protein